MSKRKLQTITLRGNAELAEHVLAWTEAQDSAVTVRRVFYAMVAQERIDNTQSEYRRVSTILTKLRRGGRLDWSRIVDTTRSAHKSRSYDSAMDAVTDALEFFRLRRWDDQDTHVEVWVEKRGAVPVLFDTTDDLDVAIIECGGKKVITEANVAGLARAQKAGKVNVILYVGDYDPSGLRMDFNMQRQLERWGLAVQWTRLALMAEDLAGLPRAFTVSDKASPQWLKKHPDVEIIGHTDDGQALVNKLEKDGNAQWFRDQHEGALFQVEVDALPIADLRERVRAAIEELLDREAYDAILAQEETERESIRSALTDV